MLRMHVLAGIALASLPVTLAHGQQSTKTYTYDQFGRLTKVEVQGGSKDGELREYSYDKSDNRTEVSSSGAGPTCVLSPIGFTVPDGTYAWPRVYTPPPYDGCGFEVELSYTITVVQVGSGSGTFTHDFFQSNDTLASTDYFKMVWINPQAGLAAPGSSAVLRVNWKVESGNAVIAAPKYSEVTITAD
ncbi:MAG: hypothetical protein AAGK01_02255 [Pseudomonadota bacterium]